ncbi:Transcription elongation factor, GreA/GreB [Opitutaceae bacterium TAV1]|nr:elongation factor GreAB [Opitutaceae bacterium TAV5]EIQ02103.1 Transcription elongation factor, GreA/GreB [Opitutaceae bacterium TAV1]
MDKEYLRAAIIRQLEAELDTQIRAARDSHDEATSEESKPENKYDMHSQEAAYLAEGQARLAGELASAIEAWRTLPLPAGGTHVATGSLVVLEDGSGKLHRYFLGPQRGGLSVETGDGEITVLTPTAPLGRQLLGRVPGDSVPLPGRRPATASAARIVHIA